MDMLLVTIGGAIGAVLRYAFLSLFKEGSELALGVFFVNIVGCFLIGFISYIAIKRHRLITENWRRFWTVGVAGGFTTFSAFSKPVLDCIINHHYFIACSYSLLSVIVGLIFVSWGMNCGYYLMYLLIKTKMIDFR